MNNKFKSLTNNKIDLSGDELVIKSKNILGVKNPKLVGSYIKYGKDKSCDLDMHEKLNIFGKNERNETLKNYRYAVFEDAFKTIVRK